MHRALTSFLPRTAAQPALGAAMGRRATSLFAVNGHKPEVEKSAWVAPNATVIGKVSLGKHSSVWFNTVIRGDNDPIAIGDRTNIQDACVLHSDEGVPLTIGNDVTVGHMVMLHGCEIGDGTLVGIGSIILNRAKVPEENGIQQTDR
eukprot:TRINITY_DN9021_c0_g1_i1.p1 TRINITY_DN9021_c0_g1~~TRINITY_DN9021_c0_g1_i1.p1  ORF type:complete len:147 (+),score=23.02 TRINITY_DN9021_c0_g1_i1:72-512(+)